jgi:NAD-dependent histone deacetylase SIR2
MDTELTPPRQSCIECKLPYPSDRMRDAIDSHWIPRCLNLSCNGLVKPEIVFFGEQLPSSFFDNRHLTEQADLAIILGTSLSVAPFSQLPQLCADETPRLLINSEKVGDLGSRADDVLLLEKCDEGVRKLAEALGWKEELEALWKETERPEVAVPKKSRDEVLQDEVDKLTKEVEKTLDLGRAQHKWLEKHVDRKIAQRREEDEEKVDDAENMRPRDDAESKSMAPIAKSEGGLSHVFPHMKKHSSSL